MVSIEVCSEMGRPFASEDHLEFLSGNNMGSCFVDSGLIYTAMSSDYDTACLHRAETLPLCVQQAEDGSPRPLVRCPKFHTIPFINPSADEDALVGELDSWRPRSGARAALIGDSIFCYGGLHIHDPFHDEDDEYDEEEEQEENRSHYTSSVFRYDLQRLRWDTISTEGHPPPGRDKFGMVAVGSKLIVFGGYGSAVPEVEHSQNSPASYVPNPEENGRRRVWNNGVYVLDTGLFECRGVCTWSELRYQGTAPAPRAACGMTMCRGPNTTTYVYVFGGRFQTKRRSDMHRLNLDTETWSGELDARGSIPCGRSWATLTAASDSKLVMCGGYNNDLHTLNDVYLFDTDVLTWCQLDTSHIPGGLEPRMWHTACADGAYGDVYILGGYNSLFSGSSCKTIVRVRTRILPLLDLCLQVLAARPAVPAGLPLVLRLKLTSLRRQWAALPIAARAVL